MLRRIYGYRAGIEELMEEVNAETQGDTVNQNVSLDDLKMIPDHELYTSLTEEDVLNDAISILVDTTTRIEALKEIMLKSLDHDGMDKQSAIMATLAANKIIKQLSPDEEILFPSLESIDEVDGRKKYTEYAIESVSDSIKETFKKILAFIKAFMDKIGTFFEKLSIKAVALKAHLLVLQKINEKFYTDDKRPKERLIFLSEKAEEIIKVDGTSIDKQLLDYHSFIHGLINYEIIQKLITDILDNAKRFDPLDSEHVIGVLKSKISNLSENTLKPLNDGNGGTTYTFCSSPLLGGAFIMINVFSYKEKVYYLTCKVMNEGVGNKRLVKSFEALTKRQIDKYITAMLNSLYFVINDKNNAIKGKQAINTLLKECAGVEDALAKGDKHTDSYYVLKKAVTYIHYSTASVVQPQLDIYKHTLSLFSAIANYCTASLHNLETVK